MLTVRWLQPLFWYYWGLTSRGVTHQTVERRAFPIHQSLNSSNQWQVLASANCRGLRPRLILISKF